MTTTNQNPLDLIKGAPVVSSIIEACGVSGLVVGHLLGQASTVAQVLRVIPVARKLWQKIFVRTPATSTRRPIILYMSC